MSGVWLFVNIQYISFGELGDGWWVGECIWITVSTLVPLRDSLLDLCFSLRCLTTQSVRPGTGA